MFHTFQVEDLIPANHPLRSIKPRADKLLKDMSRRFSAAYGRTGWPGLAAGMKARYRKAVETTELNEKVLLDIDQEGKVVGLTVEHAMERSGRRDFSYQTSVA